MKTKRLFGLDLIRAVAIVLVITIHAFANSYFHTYTINGLNSYILLCLRNICLICVPLFILLTGYLKYNKKLNKDHYKSLKKILIAYVLISIITVIFDITYQHNSFDFNKHILGIFNFTTISYAWYIEMYIGLFLLIPFLNIIYHNLKTKKHKQILIITILFLSSLPYTLYNLKVLNTRIDVLPMYWKEIYIIGYYYIGMYIREYQPKINKILNILLILLVTIIQSLFMYVLAFNSTIEKTLILDYNSIFTFIIGVLIFVLLYDINTNKEVIKKPIEVISNTTLEIYLFSYMFDIITYNYANRGVVDAVSNCYKSFITNVPLVFILSLLSGIVLRYIIKLVSMIFKKRTKTLS